MSHVAGGTVAQIHSEREVARWQKAQQSLVAGRFSNALHQYRGLVESNPHVSQLRFELGVAAAGDLDFNLAHESLQTAANLAPNDADFLVLIGQQYQGLRQFDRARQCFERAVAADPLSAHARLTLAACLERERRLEDAWDCLETCRTRHPGDAGAKYFLAFLLHRKGRNAEAETVLRELVNSKAGDANVRQSSRHLLGVVLDELGRPEEAWRWIGEAKSLLSQGREVRHLEQIYDRTSRQRRELVASLKPADILRWRAEEPTDAARHQLVFLGGHPRSGTTLIEQVLGAHPDMLAFDEPEAFTQEILNQVSPPDSLRGLTPDGLKGLSAAQRGHLRQRYFKSLLREVEGEPGAKILVDKNPSPTASLHVWLRLFPDLKVIIPLRDPRDVVLSCYFQNLTLTSANVNFLSLARTVQHYADLMDVWLKMKALGGFDWIETRYEDMVEKLEQQGKRVTNFLGPEWHPKQAQFYENARRKFVFAPTYNDVTKPVHRSRLKRWMNYQAVLEPFREKLAPYCKALGYE